MDKVYEQYLKSSPIKGGEVRIAQLQGQLASVESAVRRSLEREAKLKLRLSSAMMKVTNQRTELRRLNRTLRAMWEGVRFSHKVRMDRITSQVTGEMSRMELNRGAFDIGKMNSFTIVEAERPE